MVTFSCNSLFFHPDRVEYFNFNHDDAKDDFVFPSKDGTKLSAWRFKAIGPKKGIIIHFHGNAQNMSAHFLFVHWLTEYGYDVFVFDYRGYGNSEGKADREGLVADGAATIEFVAAHPELKQGKIAVIGQSLGGAIAVASLARTDAKINGLILDSTFASYQDVAKEVLAQHWLTWSFQWLAYLLISDDLSPNQFAGLIEIPVAVLHGNQDRTVPLSQGQELFDAIASEKKVFWIIEDGVHTEGLSDAKLGIREKVVEFLDHL